MTALTYDVVCCCNPKNRLGYLPYNSKHLDKRQLNDNTWAFSSNDKQISEIRKIPGFIESIETGKHKWKNWKKK